MDKKLGVIKTHREKVAELHLTGDHIRGKISLGRFNTKKVDRKTDRFAACAAGVKKNIFYFRCELSSSNRAAVEHEWYGKMHISGKLRSLDDVL